MWYLFFILCCMQPIFATQTIEYIIDDGSIDQIETLAKDPNSDKKHMLMCAINADRSDAIELLLKNGASFSQEHAQQIGYLKYMQSMMNKKITTLQNAKPLDRSWLKDEENNTDQLEMFNHLSIKAIEEIEEAEKNMQMLFGSGFGKK